VDAACAPSSPGYVAGLKIFAGHGTGSRCCANHAAGNWDSFGAPNGQNLYGYIGALGTKYSLLDVGFHIVIGNGPGGRPESVRLQRGPPGLANIYNTPLSCACIGARCPKLAGGPLQPRQQRPPA